MLHTQQRPTLNPDSMRPPTLNPDRARKMKTTTADLDRAVGVIDTLRRESLAAVWDSAKHRVQSTLFRPLIRRPPCIRTPDAPVPRPRPAPNAQPNRTNTFTALQQFAGTAPETCMRRSSQHTKQIRTNKMFKDCPALRDRRNRNPPEHTHDSPRRFL